MPWLGANNRSYSPGANYYLDATTATIENPLSVGGRWSLSADTTNFLTGGRIATMTGSVKGIVGDTGSSFNDDVSLLTGTWFQNQYVSATFYKNGALGNYEHELHTNSQSSGPGDHKCYALAMIAATTFQLGKWTGPFREIGSSTKGPIILRSQVALPAVMVTGDKLMLFSELTNVSPLRIRLRCIYRPSGAGGADDAVGPSDTVVLDFTDDGTNDGSAGGNAPENRDPDADGTATNNTSPILGGAPGVGFDNSFTEVLNGGYTDFRAITRAAA